MTAAVALETVFAEVSQIAADIKWKR